MIRTEYANLENPEWWKSLNGTGVVLYAWGIPKYIPIVKAIKDAGLILVSSIDTSGSFTPYASFADYTRLKLGFHIAKHGILKGAFICTASMAKGFTPSLSDIPRLRQLQHADLITIVTPQAVEIIKSLATRFGFDHINERIYYVPHPQLVEYTYDGCPKENLLLSVGRWDRNAWFQKNPKLLLAAASKFLRNRPDYRYKIIGSSVESLAPLLDQYCHSVRNQIELIPYMEAAALKSLFCKSKIAYWSSRNEGQQNTGAQALCCGSSVVSTTGIAMNCFAHYISRGSGRQCIINTPQYLADALTMEASAWDEGHRDPEQISKKWRHEFHANHVARRYISLAGISHGDDIDLNKPSASD
jgi:glycosyltransferase involved in cell wall biosynthesis